jgi:hypothetical protein
VIIPVTAEREKSQWHESEKGTMKRTRDYVFPHKEFRVKNIART